MEKFKEMNFCVHLRVYQGDSIDNLMTLYHLSAKHEFTVLQVEQAVKEYFTGRTEISVDGLGSSIAQAIGGSYSLVPLNLCASFDVHVQTQLEGQTSLLN